MVEYSEHKQDETINFINNFKLFDVIYGAAMLSQSKIFKVTVVDDRTIKMQGHWARDKEKLALYIFNLADDIKVEYSKKTDEFTILRLPF